MWNAKMSDVVSEVEVKGIPCPFVYANGRCCTGFVSSARGYGPRRGHFFTASSLFGMGGMRVPSLPGQPAPPTSGLFLCSAEKGRFFVPA